MKTKFSINGLGRIGRTFFRVLAENRQLENLSCINVSMEPEKVSHFLKYDSIFGKYDGEILSRKESLVVDGAEIPLISKRDPREIDWKSLETDIVVDCTGAFTDKESAQLHLDSGAKKVLISAPVKGADFTVCMGINNSKYVPSKHHIISSASCTTNCLAPLVVVLHKNYRIESGLMSTIHSYTTDQRLLDNSHRDMRRARSATTNIIPTTTGAATSIAKIIPEMEGKLNGISFRVPTPNGSLVDFTAILKKEVTTEEINSAFLDASKGNLKNILRYTEEPLVLQDIIGDSHSAIFDSMNTMVVEKNLIKVTAWYDNEWGYSCRLADTLQMIRKSLSP